MARFSFPSGDWLRNFLQTELRSNIALPNDVIQHIHSFIPSNSAVVIDTGSASLKLGFASEDKPRWMVPNNSSLLDPADFDSPTRAMKLGQVEDWDLMQNIWQNVLSDHMDIDTSCNAFLLSHSSFTTDTDLAKIKEIFFEVFRVPALLLADESLLVMSLAEKQTGLVCNIGYDCSTVVPVVEGQTIIDPSNVLSVGGKTITDNLTQAIINEAPDLVVTPELIEELKLKFLKINKLEYQSSRNNLQHHHQGQQYSADVFEYAAEALIQPYFAEVNSHGIHYTIFTCWQKFKQQAPEIRNVLLTGASSLIPNLNDRIRRELTYLSMHAPFQLTQFTSPHIVWQAGAALAANEDFAQLWTSRQEYQEGS
jgi:centractin